MASDLLGVSVSGLKASQASLRTVGHNIANAGTEGYSRQRVDTVANVANMAGNNYIGSGVTVSTIERSLNQFVTDQARTDTTLSAEMDSFYSHVRQMDSLLSNPGAGLSGSLNSFFEAMQNGAADPSSIPARQLIVSESDNLADRFNTVYGRLQQAEVGVDQGMEVAVGQINTLATTIGQLNVKITSSLGVTGAASPNDLLDQRDKALSELAALVPIRTFAQDNGQINVTLARGQSLVLGPTANRLELSSSPENARINDVVLVNGTLRETVTGSVNGGELGGLLRFRDEVLEPSFNKLGLIAVSLADTMNKQHAQGLDLDGEFGGLMFFDVNDQQIAESRVTANTGNTGTATLSLMISDSSRMTDGDYEVTVTADGSLTVHRLSASGPSAAPFTVDALAESISFDGMELQLESGALQVGDRFRLQPTRSGAQEFSSVLEHPQDIAFAQPFAEAAAANGGTASISGAVSLTRAGIAGQQLPNLSVVFSVDSTDPALPIYSYDIIDNTDPSAPVTLADDIVYDPAVASELFASDPADETALLPFVGVQASITGAPADGDSFALSWGGYDNRNAIALGNLQNSKTLNGGTASYGQSYGALVEGVGIATHSAKINRDAAEQVLQQSQALRESISGVNLDEEAADLIRFEQLFSANAQVISVARDVFDRLINSF